MASISVSKWIVMILLAVISIILGLLPYWIFATERFKFFNKETANSLKYKVTITVLTSIGGGVLLAISLTHMLPEGREALQHQPEFWTGLEADFPLAEILVLAGFVLIYLVEEVAHAILFNGHEEGHHHHHHLGGSHGDDDAMMIDTAAIARHNSIAHAHPNSKPTTPLPALKNRSPSFGGRKSDAGLPTWIITVQEPDSTDGSTATIVGEGRREVKKAEFASSLRSFLGLLALSFHAIMEGIAVGIQDNGHVWVMFGAVASHKFVISFCMGLELFATNAKTKTVVGSITFFGILSSVGILIGTLMSDTAETETAAIAVLKNLATGTLLYVIFFEVLNREREKRSQGDFKELSRFVGFIQLIGFVVGIVLMTLLITQVGKHEHDHSAGQECGEHEAGEHVKHAFNHTQAALLKHLRQHSKAYRLHKTIAMINS